MLAQIFLDPNAYLILKVGQSNEPLEIFLTSQKSQWYLHCHNLDTLKIHFKSFSLDIDR